jgi:hypothetical protein
MQNFTSNEKDLPVSRQKEFSVMLAQPKILSFETIISIEDFWNKISH